MFEKYAESLRGVFVATAQKVKEHEDIKNIRTAGAKLAVEIKQTSPKAFIEKLTESWSSHEDVTRSYLNSDAIARGERGDFDALDLLAWIEICKQANIGYVPASVILELTNDEAEALTVLEPNTLNNVVKTSQKTWGFIRNKFSEYLHEEGIEKTDGTEVQVDMEELKERLYNAMDSVSDNDMVRYNRTGGSVLKAIAGSGIGGPVNPSVDISASFGGGPGWVREGNRRKVDISDNRIVTAMAQAPEGIVHKFVKRPWVASARYSKLIMDPNRKDTIAGPGSWPFEWRAFVCNGVVTGVSSYYPWATNEADNGYNALVALCVKEQAQKLVDTAIANGLRPAQWSIDTLDVENEPTKEFTNLCPPGGFNCCIDFLEGENGLLFLEAGPSICPLGGSAGAHPIGFISTLEKPLNTQSFPKVEGAILSTPVNLSLNELIDNKNVTIFNWTDIENMAKEYVNNNNRTQK